jgi:hypothetical protein
VLLSAQRQPWTKKQNSSSHTHYPTIPVTPIEHHPINDLPSLSPIKQSTTLKLQKLLTYSSSKRGKKRHMISRTCFKSREPNPHSMGVEWVLLQSGLCLHRLIMSVVQFSFEGSVEGYLDEIHPIRCFLNDEKPFLPDYGWYTVDECVSGSPLPSLTHNLICRLL